MATIYMGRCHQVRTTGQPIIDTVYDHASDYSTELRITHVLPLKTPNGEIIGTMTIYRRASSNESIPDWYGNMKKAVAYIDAHYAENISIADIARESGYSESQFRRIFGRVISKSPNNYITTIRLNAARKLLTTTKKSVTEIAAEVGFFDQSHFTRAFKRERGITPGQYRRQFWNE
jgi:AraC-like DNA-binding protein